MRSARFAVTISVILLLLLTSATVSHAHSADAPQIAFTFDDLPAHGPLPPGETRLDVASKIIVALREAHMPPTYGFINGVDTVTHPEDVAILRAWLDAAHPIGNHAWSHMNLNQNSLEAFEADVLQNEPVLSSLMKETHVKKKNGDWHWFRFPFLAEGDTPAKVAGVRAFLAQHGYKVAGVTMGFGDYLWNEPYARCKAKGDQKAIASLESSYLAAAEESIGYYRDLSQKLYGRDIPYVLLMHLGAFDAEMLPRLLNLYRTKGFQFVTLEQAEKDSFYRGSIDLHLPSAPDNLEGAMVQRQLAVPTRAAPVINFEELCR